MREHESEIDHQFDVWHFRKNIKAKLLDASWKKICEVLRQWINQFVITYGDRVQHANKTRSY